MTEKHAKAYQDTHAGNLNLLVSIHPTEHDVKVYNLDPQIGLLQGFGADKMNRKALTRVLAQLQCGSRDCVYLLLNRMSINYVGMSQGISKRLTEHASKRKKICCGIGR
ncbi:MAG: hypothetical protein ACPG8W_07665 [Candidatus Promineifilaceae bacterium]